MLTGERLARLAILAAALALAACSDATDSSTAPTLDLQAQISSENPLRGEARFTTTGEAPPRMEVTDGSGRGVVVSPSSATGGFQTLPILGLRPETTYTVTVEADGTAESTTLSTGALPPDMPPIEAETMPEAMSPGLTLFDASPLDGEGRYDGYLVAVDGEGEVVWFYRQTHSIQDARRTPSGDVMFINHETGVRILDPAAEEMTEYAGTTGLEDVVTDDQGRAFAGPDAIQVDTDQ
ncbi:MAG: hypothetical protein ACLFWM_05740, partial [Actinomycetota bacterium]